MASASGIEVQITDENGENVDVSHRTVTWREGGFQITKSHAYVFSFVIMILYAFTLGMSMYLFMRSADQLTTLGSETKDQFKSISNSLFQNSETLSRTSAAIIQNQYLIYESVNGTAINMLTQNQNLQNFIAAETRMIAAIQAALQRLPAK
jgi:hypothetical protein